MNQVGFWLSAKEPCIQSMSNTQGAQAVASGRAAEDLIYCIIKERGYQINRQYRTDGTNIYGGLIRVDFYVESTPQFPDGLIIESKWQEKAGSVDEKYPYLVNNIKNRYPVPTIVVIGGDGIRDGAAQWLREQVDGAQLYAVLSMEEFFTWTIRNL